MAFEDWWDGFDLSVEIEEQGITKDDISNEGWDYYLARACWRAAQEEVLEGDGE